MIAKAYRKTADILLQPLDPDMLKRVDWVGYTSAAVLALFILTLVTVFFFPIYPDEIAVRYALSRFPYDLPYQISGAPGCSSTFCHVMPVTSYMPAVINWLVHGMAGTVTLLRLVGIVVALLWVAALVIYLNHRAEQVLPLLCGRREKFRQRLYITAFCIALFSAGVFPVFLVSNRSEQLMLPSLAVLAGLFILSRRLDNGGRAWQKIGLMVLYFVAVSLVLFGHPKGLFFTPFFIIAGWQIFGNSCGLAAFIAAMALLGLHLAQNYLVWISNLQCPEVPKLEALFKSFSFDPLSLFYDPGNFFKKAYDSILLSVKYFDKIGFSQSMDIRYLPGDPSSVFAGIFADIVNFFIKLNAGFIFFFLLACLPLRYFSRDIVKKRILTVNSALLALLACALISALFNLTKTWYDAGFYYALWLIILILFIGEDYPGVFQKNAAKKVFLYAGAAALMSQAVFIHRNLPEFLGGFRGAGVSIALHDTKKLNADILAASRACRINIIDSERLVLDDYTFLHFRKTRYPMAITYLWLENDNKSVLKFLAESGSDGVMVSSFSSKIYFAPIPELESKVKCAGAVCCVSRDDLRTLAVAPFNKTASQ